MRMWLASAALAALLFVGSPSTSKAQDVVTYDTTTPVYSYTYTYPVVPYTYSYAPVYSYPVYTYTTYPYYGGFGLSFGYFPHPHWGGYYGGWGRHYGGWGGHYGGFHGGWGGHHHR